MQTLFRLRFLLAIFFAAFALTGCFTTTAIIDPMTLTLNGKYETSAIKKAIYEAATEREWKTTPKGDGYQAELTLRRHYLKVQITYTKDEVLVKYEDSRELEYDGKNIHKKYHMWVDALFRSIKDHLSRQKRPYNV